MVEYTKKEVERLLEGKRKRGEEDLLILQPDGTRACVGWELKKGYHLYKPKKKKELSDKELLESAQRAADKRKYK